MANKNTTSLNEIGIESFIIACFASLLFIIGLFVVPVLFNLLGYTFCALALVLSICSFIEMGKNNIRGFYGFAIAGAGLSVCAPALIIILRLFVILA